MSNKSIIVVVIFILVLGVAGYFYFKKSAVETSLLNQEPQLPQSPQPQSQESQPLPEATIQTTTEVTTQTITQTTTENVTSGTQPESQSEVQNVVIYTDSGYSPRTLKVKVGEIVTFKNQSSQAMWPASAMHPSHTVYSGTSLSEHCPDTTGTAFDACTGIQPGNSWSFTFNKKGNWKYHDHLNPSFTGTIIVE